MIGALLAALASRALFCFIGCIGGIAWIDADRFNAKSDFGQIRAGLILLPPFAALLSWRRRRCPDAPRPASCRRSPSTKQQTSTPLSCATWPTTCSLPPETLRRTRELPVTRPMGRRARRSSSTRTLPRSVGLIGAWLPNFGDCLFQTISEIFARGHGSAVVLNADSPTLPTALLIETAAGAGAAGRPRSARPVKRRRILLARAQVGASPHVR